MLKKLKTTVKNIMAVPAVRKGYDAANRITLSVFASNRVFATIYSLFGFATFNREQYAVLRARRNYYRNLKKGGRGTRVELRRNIHRLEKGIIMQPRRPVFARDYIGETLDFYAEAIADKENLDASELEWAHDVLTRYFSYVKQGADETVEGARSTFDGLSQSYSRKKAEKFPYEKKDAAVSDISYEQMHNLSLQRRSVRWFKKKKVPQKLIDQAMLVARQAPTACNRLPYEFKIFTDEDKVKRVADIPFGAGGYSHQIPAIAVVVGKLDSYFSPRDRHAIYVDSSLAAMSFIYGLETLGLSSCVINWPDFEPLEMKMQKTLGLDTSERVVMLIAIGYADEKGGIPYSAKKELDTIRSYNQLDL